MADLKIDKSRYTVDSLYQWDTNQELKIYGLSMVDPEIHFTNEAMGGSIVVDCTVDESGVISVKVPNSLLQYKYSIVAYIAGFEGDTFKTYHKVTIPVKARKRPGDYTLSLSDNEVYSFQAMNRRIADIEAEIEFEGSILYNYTLDADGVKLVEASGKKSIGEYIPLVSSSLKAVKGLSDKFKTMIDANTKLGETALSIAKGINSAKVFDTTADMEAWLSDEANKGKCTVGNNLYIVDIDVPDWWIAEVLETPDSKTGYYYKIAQLEVQKVDLTTINEDIDTLQSDVETLEGDLEENITPRVENLESDTNSLKDTLGYTKSKNYLKNTGTTQTLNGITFTVNDDKSVTVNGTATKLVQLIIASNLKLPNGEYILSGCPEGGSLDTYSLYADIYDYGQGETLIFNDNTIQQVRIRIASGQTLNNLTFYPMIRKASDIDDTYEPYDDNKTPLSVDDRFNSIFNWKLVGSVTGDKPIALPDNWGELKIFAHNTSNGLNSITFSQDVISKNILDELKGTNDTLELSMGHGGTYTVNYDGQSLKNWYKGSSTISSTLNLKVYCR